MKTSIKKNSFPLATVFFTFSLALIAFLTYSDICDYFFTTTDALTLIDTSRIQSFNDVVEIFTEPMMSKTKFEGLAKYYRPLSTLSFSLDYFIWRLNPFGYHLTNLILHILVSLLVFFLIRLLTNGKHFTAWLAAIIFTTHPILIEVVPGIARRQDIIATLFLLLSLLLFLKHLHSISYKRLLLFFSILFYTFALGSKEIAIILPFLIFTYLMIFSFENPFKTNLIQTIKKCLPYLILTFIYLLWRIYVLQGIGGRPALFVKSDDIHPAIQFFKISIVYFVDLLYSLDFLILNLLFNLLRYTAISLIAILFLSVLLLYRRRIFTIINHNDRRITKLIKILLVTLVLLSLIGISLSPSISPYINQLISKAFLNEKLKPFTDVMEIKYDLPPEFYRGDFILRLLFSILLSISTICLIIIHQRHKIRDFFINSIHGKQISFFLIWLFLPLSIYLSTLTFSHFYMYNSVIPFSVILSIILVGNFQSMIQKVKEKELFNTKILSFIIVVGLSISILAYSPLVKTYKEWEASSNLSLIFFHKLSEIVTELPDNTIIYVYNLPQRIFSSKAKIPRVQTASYLNDYSIKSWLDLNYPNNNINVVSINRGGIYINISELKIEMEKNNNIVNITILGERIR